MLSVTELNEKAKTLLDTTFGYVEIAGEISRLTKHGSGHWYFTLKDDSSSVAAVMYKMNNLKLGFNVTDGMKVIVYAKVSLYVPNGSYQVIVNSLRPDGIGELELAFNQLKQKLASEGLFDITYKKPIPSLPKKIALVTSATSAALQDMLRVLTQKWKLSEIFIFDSLTQGENAPQSLIKSLKKADNYGVDVIVLARGGGSKEDLWCFNDEGLAREIFKTKTPVISAIGHEIDYVISDFVADKRALTPSAAMFDLLPDEDAYFQYIDTISNDIFKAMELKFKNLQSKLELLNIKLSTDTILAKIDTKISKINNLKMSLENIILNKISLFTSDIRALKIGFDTREDFFKKTENLVEIRSLGKNINLQDLNVDDEIQIISQNISRQAKITK
ncbi:exodeoxyribonuclease VII large subunit [Campylobacter pinnipediorum]|uniref:exodeoxyribonuclease VII large subunit n=1 Tax=Campylobacter pinnipediorum TaxID=1965231 RepID=UPI00084D0606|nr:exodeoxyribonuclease VII large subunit [Campylobacter pinnipediorum]